jgi:hypothetical protein
MIRLGLTGSTWCWTVFVPVLLASCAHDPAPKAHCHGPWIWLNEPPIAAAPDRRDSKAASFGKKGADRVR